jgi:hypothetical protein
MFPSLFTEFGSIEVVDFEDCFCLFDVGCNEADEMVWGEETAEMEGGEEVLLDLETLLLLGDIRGFPLGHSRP